MPLKLHLDEQPSLNLTAMLDIMFLLLIFFVLNTKFLDDERQINLQVPQVNGQNKLAAADQQKTVNVYKDGTVRLDGTTVSLGDLTARLAAARKISPQLGVLVRGDGHGELQLVADVLAACKQAGVNDVAMAVRSTR